MCITNFTAVDKLFPFCFCQNALKMAQLEDDRATEAKCQCALGDIYRRLQDIKVCATFFIIFVFQKSPNRWRNIAEG